MMMTPPTYTHTRTHTHWSLSRISAEACEIQRAGEENLHQPKPHCSINCGGFHATLFQCYKRSADCQAYIASLSRACDTTKLAFAIS